MRAMPLRVALLAALLAPLASEAARAQTIAGAVLEDSTRMPISGADVTVLSAPGGPGPTVRTDSLGAFHVKLDSAGQVRLRVSHPSYQTLDSDSIDVDEGEAVTVELRLGRAAIPLKPLVVTARVDARVQAFHERAAKGTGFGKFMTREDIERHRTAKVTDLVRGISGVRVVPITPCRGCSPTDVLYLRGGPNVCAPTVLIDGLAVKQDAVFSLDGFLMPDMLEGVEVYVDPAGVPPSLAVGTSSCGVVAFWTRRPEGKNPLWVKLLAGGAAVLMMLLLIAH